MSLSRKKRLTRDTRKMRSPKSQRNSLKSLIPLYEDSVAQAISFYGNLEEYNYEN